MGDILSKEEIDLLTENLLDYQRVKPKKKIKTVAQALKVVKENRYALRYVPEELRTTEVCLEAIKVRCVFLELEYIPENAKTVELYIEIVKRHSWELVQEYIPEKFRTTELWLEVVKKDEWLLAEVPEKIRTAEFWFEAVKKTAWLLTKVPEKFKTIDMYIEAVKQEDWLFMLVPESLKEQVIEATEVQGGATRTRYKYESVLEIGMKKIFEMEAERICIKLIKLCEIARREGILALENFIDKEKLLKKDFLETGIQMAVDGMQREIVEKYIDSWIETNCNNSVAYYEKILASIIKAGVLCLQAGEHPKVAEYKMTVLIPRELIPDSLLPEKEGYFRKV
ncbi:MAG: hypothetical protein LBC75_09320 [Fibromonadaceae bacterium]|jgi:hypothetical protein|nr:hypothetical protein [Fibromonadaceae bacterium]